jgi:signal peptidase I
MELSFDSPLVKIAIVGTLLGARAFVQLFSPVEANGQRSETARSIIETLDSAAIALGLVLFIIQPFLLQAFHIPSSSMANTLKGPPIPGGPGGDRLLVSKLIYHLREPEFQDIIVFKAPDASGSGGVDFIKRYIGTPGHVVEIKKGQLFRDGKPSLEPYANLLQPPQSGFFSYDMKIVDGKIYSREYRINFNTPDSWVAAGATPPVVATNQNYITNALAEKVPPGQLLMLGDNRHNSHDSHAWGFVPRENVVGKAIFVFWPPKRIGLLEKKSKIIQQPVLQRRTPGTTTAPVF